MRSNTVVFSLGLAVAALSGCEGELEESITLPASADECDADVGLLAHVQPEVGPSGITVYGSTAPPQNVTIRAIYVAGVSVTRTEFNFRGWQVDVPRARLDAIATDGQAHLPVIAFTSIGCAALPPERQPLVRFPDPDDGAPDTSIGGAGGGLP